MSFCAIQILFTATHLRMRRGYPQLLKASDKIQLLKKSKKKTKKNFLTECVVRLVTCITVGFLIILVYYLL